MKAKQNFKMTDGLLYSLVYTFGMTFICYPGLAMDDTIKFLLSSDNYRSWHVLFTQIVFALFDTTGRIVGGASVKAPCLSLSNKWVNIGSAGRTIFLGTFLLIAFDV